MHPIHTPYADVAELAARLGVEEQYFLDRLGSGWTEAGEPEWHDHDHDADPSGGGGWPVTPWHVTGEPEQLMVRVSTGHCSLARPVGRWVDLGTLRWEPTDVVHLDHPEVHDPDRLDEVVQRLVRSRRRRLLWCRTCRVLQAPERMLGGQCHGCAPVVF